MHGKTQLLYLPRFDVLEGEARVVECWPEDDSWCVVLDQTVFYPGGGGQPPDVGELIFEQVAMPLQALWMNDDGIVIHRIADSAETLRVGSVVHMRVDADTRLRHCRLHSAGHVIDMAVSALGYRWAPTKGAHFPHMSFVEYETDDDLEEGIKETLQSQCNWLVSKGSSNAIRFADDAGRQLATPGLGHLQAERIVSYNDFAVACGGTHVPDIADIGKIVIRKVKKKKGVIKVSYTVEPL